MAQDAPAPDDPTLFDAAEFGEEALEEPAGEGVFADLAASRAEQATGARSD
jgi:hypothetical protein